MLAIPPPSVLALLVLSGITVYDVLHQLSLWIGRRSDTVHLWMSGLGLGALAFQIGRLVHYLAPTVSTARIAMCVEETAVICILFLALVVSFALVGKKLPRVIGIVALTTASTMIAILWLTEAFIQNHGWFWTDSLGQTYFFLQAGRFHWLFIPYGFLTFLAVFNVLIRSELLLPSDLRIIIVSAAAAVLLGTHDVLVGLRLLSTPIVLEYGMTAVSLGLSFVSIRLFHRTRSQLERLLKQRSDVLQTTNVSLQEAVEDAAEAVKVKARFLANMSHEIRTPMSGVIGLTDLLRHSRLSREQAELVGMIAVSGKSLLTILEDILEFSKIESDKMQLKESAFDLHQVVEEAVGIFSGIAQEKGLTLEAQVSPNVRRHLIGDPMRLRQVLSNLVGNAVKFTPSGAVTVRVTPSDHATPPSTSSLTISVQDSGIGIVKKSQKAIMEPFVQADGTTERRFGGTGLGLAISDQIVRKMGGRITIDSTAGQGSTFSFTLNLKLAPEQDENEDRRLSLASVEDGLETPLQLGGACAAADEATDAPVSLTAVRVLVAEDDPINRKVIKRMLAQLGCHITMARNGREVLERYGKEKFDIILMDCQMPVLGGYAATEAIRQEEKGASHKARIPIVALTAHALSGDRDKCLDAGMDDYLTKPVDMHDLARTISSLVETESADVSEIAGEE